ncbi:MAG: hypothetical protein Q8O95_05795 [bacterium]|nr:hypothetical protein [bacterium]
MITFAPAKTTPEMQKNCVGYSVISLPNGNIVGIGENSMIAMNNAKAACPDLDEEKVLISHIHGRIVIGPFTIR